MNDRHLQATRSQRCSHRTRIRRPYVAEARCVRLEGYFIQGKVDDEEEKKR
jgi:hypothetical protein